MFRPRPHQQRVIEYTHGKMGVSAVPGSGKTQTLSHLAAKLILDQHFEDDQEILIVTLVNSAVDNFSNRIRTILEPYGLLKSFNYRVRTLHGLAHDIVRERPDLAGLSNRFAIIDERDSNSILSECVANWLRIHPDFIELYLNPDLVEERTTHQQREINDQLVDLAASLIRQAKDYQLGAEEIRQRLAEIQGVFPLLDFGCDIYSDYQRALNFREAVDFDDLISMALRVLQIDPDYLARLRYRWPYILEDEAQDSSRLQEQILRTLAGEEGNWVRVGDPNQAIFETFTTASPHFLLDFLDEPGVHKLTLPNSGRSTPSIIRLANLLIDWTRRNHPVVNVRDALVMPHIEPTPPGDPQPNPPDESGKIYLQTTPLSAEREITVIVRSIKSWLEENPDATLAVLVPRNERGEKVVEELKNNQVEYHELLKSSPSTRKTADLLNKILESLADPTNPTKLSHVYRLLRPTEGNPDEINTVHRQCAEHLRHCAFLEAYLWPRPDADWLQTLAAEGIHPDILAELEWLHNLVTIWQNAAALPIDQLLLTIAQTLFDQPADLALAHKLALVLEREAALHPDWQLPMFSERLQGIARNQQKFIGMDEDDTGFNPEQHRGKAVVATIHKAKGLEWDRVYLLSVNNYDFPSAQSYDTYIGEKWFIRGRLNLQAEALAQLKALYENDVTALYLPEGAATETARLDYVRERLRLLFVGITRAKKDLSITWNNGRSNREALMALPLEALTRLFYEDEA